jgi:hypothetical protein
VVFVLLGLSVCSVFAQNSVTYIQVNTYNSPSYNLVKMDDFLKLLNDNKIKTVFYTDRQFIIQAQNIAYTINSIGYTNLIDYKDGNDKGFNDGNAYYYAKELNLPNQTEVDYYNSEFFFSIDDYRDATHLGITHNKEIIKKFYGLISADDFQKNIRYANLVIYLYSYLDKNAYNGALKNNGLTDQQIFSQYIAKQTSGQSQRRTDEGLVLLNNTTIETLTQKSGNYIRKLDNFNYCLIDIPLLSNSEASFYYGFKLAQFLNTNELANNILNDRHTETTSYSTKETNRILSSLGFTNINYLLDADHNAITNSKDYYLIMEYGITKNRLEENRALIKELETIKTKYLSNYEPSQSYSSYDSKQANQKSQYAFLLFNILKLKKGEPVTIDIFVRNVQKNYPGLYNIFRFETYTVEKMFNEMQLLNSIIVYNNGVFYLK